MSNEVLKAMKERRSIRNFKPDAVPKDTLNEIIEAGLYAASGRNKQGTVIVSVTDKKLRDKIMEMNRKIGGWDEGFDPFYGAPAMLIVLGDKSVPTYIYDGSLVMGNLMLAAHSLDMGSCWIHRAKQEFESEDGKAILKELGIEGDFEGIGHCAIGYPAEEKEIIPRKENRVFYK
mgnify:CR=1 FL=1